jgi:hypothetical protein
VLNGKAGFGLWELISVAHFGRRRKKKAVQAEGLRNREWYVVVCVLSIS